SPGDGQRREDPPHYGRDARRDQRGEQGYREHRDGHGCGHNFSARPDSPHRSPAPKGVSRSPARKATKLQAPAHGAQQGAEAVIAPPPDINRAHRNTRGHPIFPEPVSASDDSEYNATDDKQDAVAHTALYRDRERNRLFNVSSKKRNAPPPARLRDANELGLWFNVEIETYDDTRNLLRWSAAGEHTARALVVHFEHQYGCGTELRRSEGIALVMRELNPNRAAYGQNNVLKGGSRPRGQYVKVWVTI
ncbi:hypothetical protein B0H16DRAFT_1481614, partial [Mycena metata]